jgi:hypothetical protein
LIDDTDNEMGREVRDVIDSFLRAHPDYKFVDRLPRYVLRYFNAIREQVIRQGTHKTGVSYSFSLQRARDQCQQITINKRRQSAWAVFHQIHPIIQVLEEGSNMTGKVSKVLISDRYLDLLIKTADGPELISSWYSDADTDSEVEYIPIDHNSLNHYIMATEQDIATATNDKYKDKLTRSLRQARQIQVVADYLMTTGITQEYAWPHIGKPSSYGRTYYTGLSLHNCNREVRRAAIGTHFQYDIEAAVYAIKLMLVDNIYTELGETTYGEFVNTKEYLDYKSPIRRRLAKHITKYSEPLRVVKTAMTAVGFGARLQNSSWTDDDIRQYGSLTTIIKDPEDRQRFITDPWVVQFVREQQKMTDIIAAYWIRDEEMSAIMRTVPNMLTPTGKFRKNQVVCYMFQQMEQQIMNAVFADQPYLVRIHDACISKTPLNMLLINQRLQQISPYLSIDRTYSNGYYRECNDHELVEHVDRITREEQVVAKMHDKPMHWPELSKIKKMFTETEHYTGRGYNGSNYDPELDPFYED